MSIKAIRNYRSDMQNFKNKKKKDQLELVQNRRKNKKKPLDPQPELRSFERDGIESELGTDETEKEETEIWKG